VTETAPDYSFARAPKWLLSHLLVAALIVAMATAGIWQINRHGERADRNATVTERAALEPVPLGTVAGPDAGAEVGEIEQFRQVSVVGEYRVEDEVLIRNRTLEGAPGWWVITPFVTDEGWAVAVNRGWIPLFFEADAPRPGTEPPTGRVTVVGTVQPSRTAEGFQVADPETGVLSTLARPDVARLGQQLDYPLSPVVLQLEPTGDEQAQPVPLALPALDRGPHISYAVQWFVFTTIALVGYPLVLRRVARGRSNSMPYDA
jgi:cytochrome oxidase assembly protein ShyY1